MSAELSAPSAPLTTRPPVLSVVVLANLSVTYWLFADAPRWWMAGPLGALVSAFWSYAMSAVLVWPGKRRDSRLRSVSPSDTRGLM